MAKYPSKSSMVGMIALALVSSVALAAKPTGGTGGGGNKGGGGGDTGTNPATIALTATGIECTVSGSGLPTRSQAWANCRGESASTLSTAWGCALPDGSWDMSAGDVTTGALTPASQRVNTDRKGRATAIFPWALNPGASSEVFTACQVRGGTWSICSVTISGGESWWTDGSGNLYGAKTPLKQETLYDPTCTGA